MRLRLLIEIEADPAMVEQVRAMVADGHVVALDPMVVKRDRITGTVVGAVPVEPEPTVAASMRGAPTTRWMGA